MTTSIDELSKQLLFDTLIRVLSGTAFSSIILFIFIRQKRQHSMKRKWNDKLWKRNTKKHI